MNKEGDKKGIRLKVSCLVKGLFSDCSCAYISQNNMERFDIYRGDMHWLCSNMDGGMRKLSVIYSEDLDDITLGDSFIYLNDYLMRNLKVQQGDFIEIVKIEEDIHKLKNARLRVFHESEISNEDIHKEIREFLVKDNRPLNLGDYLGLDLNGSLVEFMVLGLDESSYGIVYESTQIHYQIEKISN